MNMSVFLELIRIGEFKKGVALLVIRQLPESLPQFKLHNNLNSSQLSFLSPLYLK